MRAPPRSKLPPVNQVARRFFFKTHIGTLSRSTPYKWVTFNELGFVFLPIGCITFWFSNTCLWNIYWLMMGKGQWTKLFDNARPIAAQGWPIFWTIAEHGLGELSWTARGCALVVAPKEGRLWFETETSKVKGAGVWNNFWRSKLKLE